MAWNWSKYGNIQRRTGKIIFFNNKLEEFNFKIEQRKWETVDYKEEKDTNREDMKGDRKGEDRKGTNRDKL